MNRKSKGTNAERELIKMFWSAGYAAMRAAGSGSARHPSPDIIASNKIRKLAIECKSTKNLKIYLSKEDVNQLIEFSNIFGAEPWFAARFNKLKWFFLTIEDLEKTPTGFVISIENIRNKGLVFEELTSDSIV